VKAEGQTDCKHYKGIKGTKSRKCCGGKVIHRTEIDCAAHGCRIYAENHCKADICKNYAPK
jgi:hypothetical protein